MDLNAATSKFKMNNILGIAAVMIIVFALYKLFVRQYMTQDGVIHTSFKTPEVSVNKD